MKQVGSLAAGTAPELVISKAGPDAYKNMLGQVIGRFTYCPKEGEAQGAQDRDGLRHAVRDFEKARNPGGPSITDYFNIANGYDAVTILKLAIEGSGGKTDGETLSKWILDNTSKIQLASRREGRRQRQDALPLRQRKRSRWWRIRTSATNSVCRSAPAADPPHAYQQRRSQPSAGWDRCLLNPI